MDSAFYVDFPSSSYSSSSSEEEEEELAAYLDKIQPYREEDAVLLSPPSPPGGIFGAGEQGHPSS